MGKLQLIELLEAMQKLLSSVALLGSQAVYFLLLVFDFSFWLLCTGSLDEFDAIAMQILRVSSAVLFSLLGEKEYKMTAIYMARVSRLGTITRAYFPEKFLLLPKELIPYFIMDI